MSNTPITDMAISACPDMESLYYTQTLQHCSHRLELALATAKRKIAAQKLDVDCRTCVYWTGEDCNNNAQCVDADLYRQISNTIQIWKRR